jgi:hypothetical protein
MKKFAVLLAALPLAFLIACTPTEKKQDTPPPPKAAGQECAPAAQPGSAKQIIQNYGSTLSHAPGQARSVQAKVDLGAISEAVRNFMVENGKYPESLDMVKSYLRPGTDLSAFSYDPSSGTVCVK